MPSYIFYIFFISILFISKINCCFMRWAKTNIRLTFVRWSFCWHSGLLCATYYFAACFLCIREFATRKISFNFTVQQTLCWHCFWWPPLVAPGVPVPCKSSCILGWSMPFLLSYLQLITFGESCQMNSRFFGLGHFLGLNGDVLSYFQTGIMLKFFVKLSF